MSTVTLIDGTEVDSADARWRDECMRVHRHVVTMRTIGRDGRNDYLAAIQRTDGAAWAKRVAEAYLRDWTERRQERERS